MDFNIRPVSRVCCVTGDPLAPGDECWSVLMESEGKLVRQDFSVSAWRGAPEGAIGHWRYQIPSREAAARLIDTNSLFDYFVQLCESPNNVEIQYRYVLALLLLRKRRLILEDNIEVDDQPAMLLTGSEGEGPFEIVEVALSPEEIDQLQDQLFDSSGTGITE